MVGLRFEVARISAHSFGPLGGEAWAILAPAAGTSDTPGVARAPCRPPNTISEIFVTTDAPFDRKHASPGLLSVVVPVLNEAGSIDALLARLVPVLESTGHTFEVIFIDDGSTDDTLPRLRRANSRDPRVKAISFSRNFGKEVAVAAGLKQASGEVVVLMDGDLQHPPELIPAFLARWHDGYDIVYGRREDRTTDSLPRRLFARAFYATFKLLSGTQLPVEAGDFRLFSRRAVDALNRLGERARFNKGLFTWIGFKSAGIDFAVTERADGSPSRWRPRKLLHFALDGLASFSTIPLRIWSYVGLTLSALAFIYIIVFLAKTLLFGIDQAGFPTLIISIMFFAGVQLISLGVIGEYLGRIYEEVKARPLYLVAEEVGFEAARPGESDSMRSYADNRAREASELR